MTKNRVKVKASSIMQKAQSGSVFVVASCDSSTFSESNIVKKHLANASAFSCNDCGTHMTTASLKEPFCVTCGSDEVVKAATKTLSSIPDEKMTAVICHSCNTIQALEKSVVASAGYQLHCSACGTDLQVSSEAEDPEESEETTEEAKKHKKAEDTPPATEAPVTEAPATDVPPESESAPAEDIPPSDADTPPEDKPAPTPSEASESAPDKDDPHNLDDFFKDVKSETESEDETHTSEEEDDEPMVTESDMSDAEDLVTDEAPKDSMEFEAEPVESTHSELVQPPAVGFQKNMDKFLNNMNGVESNSDEMPMNDAMPTHASDEVVVDDSQGDPIAEAMSMDDTAKGVSMCMTAGRLVVSKGHVAIASLSHQNAGPNADLLGSPAFEAAFRHTASTTGLRKALATYNFQPIRVPTITRATLQKEVAKVKTSVKAAEQERIRKFTDAFALASVGLSRGKWKGYSNPLFAAFTTELTKVGVRNPQRVAASIFDQHSVQFSKALIEISSKLLNMSESARKEMAEMLNMTASDATQSIEQEFAGDDLREEIHAMTDVESHLMTTASTSTRSRPNTVQASSVAADILNGRAALSFNV